MTLPHTHTLAEVAASLRVCKRTLQRAIARADIALPRVGVAIRVTAEDVQQIREALRCRSGSHESAAASGMSAADVALSDNEGTIHGTGATVDLA